MRTGFQDIKEILSIGFDDSALTGACVPPARTATRLTFIWIDA
jgi:hypothetical protein